MRPPASLSFSCERRSLGIEADEIKSPDGVMLRVARYQGDCRVVYAEITYIGVDDGAGKLFDPQQIEQRLLCGWTIGIHQQEKILASRQIALYLRQLTSQEWFEG